MILHENLTYYDILDLATNATAQEVREAYLRAKSTFHRDSVALYTLITPEDREDTMKKIEEAYHVLSHPELRRQYDQSYGFLPNYDNPLLAQDDTAPTTHSPPEYFDFEQSASQQNPSANTTKTPEGATVVSIDRVPPMENSPNGDDLLIPPKTDFLPPKPQPSSSASSRSASPAKTGANRAGESDHSRAFRPFRDLPNPVPPLNPVLAEAIEMEKEWSGPFLKKVREAYRISLEEMSGITKVTKTYLSAIEEENYSKLPAPVYIRGFVTQMAKVLRLPSDKVALAYLNRYYRGLKSPAS